MVFAQHPSILSSGLRPWQAPGLSRRYTPISLPLLISSNNRTFYDRHQLLWSAGMMARALIVRIYSLGLVWRRGGRWRALADCWQSERRDRPMSGRECYHGVTQQLLCCGQRLWSTSGSGTVLCMGAKKILRKRNLYTVNPFSSER